MRETIDINWFGVEFFACNLTKLQSCLLREVSNDEPNISGSLKPSVEMFSEVIIGVVFKDLSLLSKLETLLEEDGIKMLKGLLVRLLQIGVFPITHLLFFLLFKNGRQVL